MCDGITYLEWQFNSVAPTWINQMLHRKLTSRAPSGTKYRDSGCSYSTVTDLMKNRRSKPPLLTNQDQATRSNYTSSRSSTGATRNIATQTTRRYGRKGGGGGGGGGVGGGRGGVESSSLTSVVPTSTNFAQTKNTKNHDVGHGFV